MALFSSGSVWDEDSPNDSGPANTTSCVFEGNTAIDGGGIYSTAGYDIIKESWFGRNMAGEPERSKSTRMITPEANTGIARFVEKRDSAI